MCCITCKNPTVRKPLQWVLFFADLVELVKVLLTVLSTNPTHQVDPDSPLLPSTSHMPLTDREE